ncbi:uncharacterized protein LACBIDRAFT_308560 [Laccaria bicolor S238N-H82]|uniref:Predicted protein n=1 Tax=Laccaria bicolor (strain S238N-H82 / ATCC MYA-4686) TaxID=486041 RepID=B0CWN5_LACBS|nr:uncharacterized protein LACBIDRAFT_308560 [Laccaria bicolor S238N-H82]EDR13540.1 predicted protein [Laccaria bicolor S238N-H82]|eukprot:XP_001876038.1 predicted protein [Laccaria bicolor S238N-H82]
MQTMIPRHALHSSVHVLLLFPFLLLSRQKQCSTFVVHSRTKALYTTIRRLPHNVTSMNPGLVVLPGNKTFKFLQADKCANILHSSVRQGQKRELTHEL